MRSKTSIGASSGALAFLLFVGFGLPLTSGSDSDISAGTTVQELCNCKPGVEVTLPQARCIAEAIGMKSGLGDWDTEDGFSEVFAEPSWMLQNQLIETFEGCCSLGMSITISKLDGAILGYGTVETVCRNDEVRCRPYLRPREAED